MWGVEAKMYDWASLKEDIKKNGMRNSLLVAPMPTASTSQILGNNETFEAFTSNVYSRRVLSGEFICVNRHLIEELVGLGMWTEAVRQKILAFNGSIQDIKEIPEEIRRRYRTVWEIRQKAILNLAIGRGPFIDQSQSLNIHLAEPDIKKISSMHFHGWKNGLKTGMYYLRSRPAADAIKFTVDQKAVLEAKQVKEDALKKREDPPAQNQNASQNQPPKKSKLKTMTEEEFNEEETCLNCGS